ncbi:hypothetical protein COCON_G00120090 [Conger conger]|uniref:Uncharacterized protein n=1 Tax=Conger conger TaxID=82655 RepID=A0A9Q1DGN4_CONCO|nr:hypothetical protein COCON_G00120090 [Conger conger]
MSNWAETPRPVLRLEQTRPNTFITVVEAESPRIHIFGPKASVRPQQYTQTDDWPHYRGVTVGQTVTSSPAGFPPFWRGAS